MSTISFPLGIAEGRYFCNRIAETKLLISNIQHATHTVLVAPRRYGKTSLAYRAIDGSHLPYGRVDLYMTTSEKDITKAILAGIDSILSQVSHQAETLLGLVKDYIKSLRPSFEAGVNGIQIKLEPAERITSAANIAEALQVLDGVLKKKSMHAVLLIDEFQEVQRIAPDQGIEGAIRHVAQEAKNFTLIFSGSHRHLLHSLFNDKSKPLYKLCDEIYLQRISEKDYMPFINAFAKEKWKKNLTQPVIHKILNVTECHPYYFNVLCEKLFAQENIPSESDVNVIWHDLINAKKKDILAETKNLALIHKKLLVAISHGIDHELTGRKFLSQEKLSGASVIRALEYLEDNDFIEKENNHYHLIDPLLKGIINALTYF